MSLRCGFQELRLTFGVQSPLSFGIWGSYYNIPKAIFYLLKGDYICNRDCSIWAVEGYLPFLKISIPCRGVATSVRAAVLDGEACGKESESDQSLRNHRPDLLHPCYPILGRGKIAHSTKTRKFCKHIQAPKPETGIILVSISFSMFSSI